MRIISGTHRGHRIVAPKNMKARPTTDYGKESLFNILENKIELVGLEVLDLFGGTGNISYEFASRGASKITCVDITLNSYKFINTFAIKNDMPIKAIRSDVFKFLKKGGNPVPLVFADPPYNLKNILDIPKTVFENNWILDGGLLIVEHGEETDFSKELYFKETRPYSRVNFSFFQK